MGPRTQFIGILLAVVALAATALVLRQAPTSSEAEQSADSALNTLGMRDGEQNPLVSGDAVAGSASFWRSSLERRASSGEASAAFELSQHYKFTTDDRASALQWLVLAARNGHEVAQLNLAVETGKLDCQVAMQSLQTLAAETRDGDLRETALNWLEDPYLCAA